MYGSAPAAAARISASIPSAGLFRSHCQSDSKTAIGCSLPAIPSPSPSAPLNGMDELWTPATTPARRTAASVCAVRRTVRAYARSCGLGTEQVEGLELAASELASNCIRHGGGQGSIAMWREPDAVLVEFSCRGRLTDPLAGRRRPDPLGDGGMGLYLVHQLCDLVQTRTGAAGTTVRVSTWA